MGGGRPVPQAALNYIYAYIIIYYIIIYGWRATRPAGSPQLYICIYNYILYNYIWVEGDPSRRQPSIIYMHI